MKIVNNRNSPVEIYGAIACYKSLGQVIEFVGVFHHPNTPYVTMAVFYDANPDTSKGHKNYFAFFFGLSGKLFITDGSWVEGLQVFGAVHDGTFHYSNHGHDFNEFADGLFIDGGHERVRTNAKTCATMTIKGGKWVHLNTYHYGEDGSVQVEPQ